MSYVGLGLNHRWWNTLIVLHLSNVCVIVLMANVKEKPVWNVTRQGTSFIS